MDALGPRLPDGRLRTVAVVIWRIKSLAVGGCSLVAAVGLAFGAPVASASERALDHEGDDPSGEPAEPSLSLEPVVEVGVPQVPSTTAPPPARSSAPGSVEPDASGASGDVTVSPAALLATLDAGRRLIERCL